MWPCFFSLQQDTLATRENMSLFPHPWVWTGLETCFDQWNAAETMLCDFQSQAFNKSCNLHFCYLRSHPPSCQEAHCRLLVEDNQCDPPDSQHQLLGFSVRPSWILQSNQAPDESSYMSDPKQDQQKNHPAEPSLSSRIVSSSQRGTKLHNDSWQGQGGPGLQNTHCNHDATTKPISNNKGQRQRNRNIFKMMKENACQSQLSFS